MVNYGIGTVRSNPIRIRARVRNLIRSAIFFCQFSNNPSLNVDIIRYPLMSYHGVRYQRVTYITQNNIIPTRLLFVTSCLRKMIVLGSVLRTKFRNVCL